MNAPELRQAIDVLQQQRYAGPTPAWPEPRRRFARPPLLFAGAAAAALVAAVLLPKLATESAFGADYKPRPSAYSALKQARSALPGEAAPGTGALTLTRLPPRPAKQSGFAADQTEASVQLKSSEIVG
ncbi:MAG: hypothetical protein AAF358_20005 [Pseudomonadota bacterium]